MTTPILILVKNHCSLVALAECVATALGISLKEIHRESIGNSFSGDIFDGCHVDVFGDHGFEDDQGIPFSAYGFAVDIAVRDKWEYGTGKEEVVAIAKKLSRAIADRFGTQCLLVDNLQTVLAAIEPKESGRD